MQYTALSRQLTQMRQSLDTAQQALNILKNGQQVLMQTLIDKWKGVIRDAAEELFDDAKARVEQNGGLTRSTRRPNFEDNAHDKLSDEQKDMLQYQQEEDKAQARKYGLLPSTEPPDGGEESTVSLSHASSEPTDTPTVLHNGHYAATDGRRSSTRRL